jgi:uncharacterized protein
MKIWGYWATLGWAILAFFAGQLVGTVLLWWSAGDFNALLANPYDGISVTIAILVANPVMIAVLALAVRLARADQVEYLALKWPEQRYVTLAIGLLFVLIALCDAALYLTGHPLVPPSQLQAYTTAATEGWLPAMLIGAVIVAPAGEEVMFRGFLFRGWVRSERFAWPAIIVISLLWASLHVQYDGTGILEIFVVGLFLGWTRWRSGSMLLTFLLHALFNLEAMSETALRVHFFS